MFTAVLIAGMLMQPKMPRYTPPAASHSAPAAPKRVSRVTAPPARPSAHKPAVVSCREVTDLGQTSYLTTTSPYYAAGETWCDSASYETVVAHDNAAYKSSQAQQQGKVYCQYERMDEALCSDGTYASDPSEQSFYK